ncbi:MAG: trigger factor [Thermoleophilaceae bacterium]|nr:trigger factor [Thermoleophilaceae bacterium]
MATAVTTKRTELGDARVRLEVEVEPDAVERELQTAARELGRDMKLAGFRKGKVPPPVVIQRVGRAAVLDEAVRRALPAWYEQAVSEAGVVAVGDPQLALEELPEKGSPLGFSVEVGVRPTARLGDLDALEVGRREPAVAGEEVDAEVDRLRESMASLETVDRAAAEGDFTVLDFEGRIDGEPFEGGEARGFLLELGSGRLVEGFEQQLVGASAGDEREVRVEFPDDYRAEALAGREAAFQVAVKEVKEKRLPGADDELAAEAGGFDTLGELRSQIESSLRERDEQAIEHEFREAVVDAAVARSDVDIPDDLAHAKAHEMWSQTARRLRSQGIEPGQYLQIVGKDEEELVHETEDDARTALGRESLLAAVVEAEGIETSDEEVIDALRAAAAAQGGDSAPSEKQLRRSLDQARRERRDEMLREDIAMRKAVDALVERAKPIPAERAQARDKLWTPESEAPAGEKQIWTPGS